MINKLSTDVHTIMSDLDFESKSTTNQGRPTIILKPPAYHAIPQISATVVLVAAAHERDANPVATPATVLPMTTIGNITKVLRKKKKISAGSIIVM